MTAICPCDDHDALVPANSPGLDRISARHGDWLTIRRALVERRLGETALADWAPGGGQDLATMILEWWATLGEVLEFYNDEIANEAFLATATQEASVKRLISLLGYRPRPALAATATVAAVLSSSDAIALPKGFAVDSIPAAGQKPQTFELDEATELAPGGRIEAQPPAALASPEAGILLLEGRVRGVAIGDRLRLRTPAGDRLLTIASIAEGSAKPVHSRLGYTADAAISPEAVAAGCRLERAGLSLPVWTFAGSPISGSDLHLAGLSRAIAAGDSVLVTAPGKAPLLAVVSAVSDILWYANPPGADPAVAPSAPTIPLPVPHSRLTLATAPGAGWNAATMSVQAGWVEVGKLLDQPPAAWTGSPSTLEALSADGFPGSVASPALIAGAEGIGVPASLTASAGASSADAVVDPAYAGFDSLAAPLDILTGLLALTRGKSVAREIVGSGDARIAGQSFTLAKSPVTYVRAGATYASSVVMLVDGAPWTEVSSFYGQAPDASVYTLKETEEGATQVHFGDGVNGRRLPTGKDNVVAGYRHGAGAEAPAAGKLTRIPSPYPGLARILNPVAAGGGADAEPADQIRLYAPRSVLTLGRAVSVADFEAFAASAAAPHRVNAVWAWDEARQRTAVTVYVAGGPDICAAVAATLAAAGDPHRPVAVSPAVAVPLSLSIALLIESGYESEPIVAAVAEALVGEAGLFSAEQLGIGEPLFMSSISAAALSAAAGIVTIREVAAARLDTSAVLAGPLHRVEENEWFDLAAEALTIGIEVDHG